MQPATSDPIDPTTYRVSVGHAQLALADFLLFCAAGDNAQLPPDFDMPAWSALRQVFLDAGVRALEAHAEAPRWLQFGLTFAGGKAPPELYARVRDLVHELFQKRAIDNFFFMHKPPGMRLRFHLGASEQAVAHAIRAQIDDWQRAGLIERGIPGVYEPETYLFGGPLSMRSVHDLFTADSLAWLSYHARATPGQAAPPPAWVLSLLMLRALFAALHIADWEDLDVWERVQQKTGRSLPPGALPASDLADVAEGIQAMWRDPQAMLDELPAWMDSIFATFQAAVIPIGERWHTDYFATGMASVGPRAVAALAVIFHWNRAALPLARQALLTQALLERETI